jgi:hypothetical protein
MIPAPVPGPPHPNRGNHGPGSPHRARGVSRRRVGPCLGSSGIDWRKNWAAKWWALTGLNKTKITIPALVPGPSHLKREQHRPSSPHTARRVSWRPAGSCLGSNGADWRKNGAAQWWELTDLNKEQKRSPTQVQLSPLFKPIQSQLTRLFRHERPFAISGCLLRWAPLPAWRASPGLRELSGSRGHGRRRRTPAPHRCRVGGLALSAGLLRCEHCHLRNSPAFSARTASLTDAGLSSLFGLSVFRAEKPAHSVTANL